MDRLRFMDSWYRYRRSLMGTIPGILLCSSSTGFVQDAGYRMIGYRIQGRVQDTGFRIQQTGHRQDAGYRIQDAGDRIQETRYRIIIQDIGYRIGYGIQDTGYRIRNSGYGTGYRIQDTRYRNKLPVGKGIRLQETGYGIQHGNSCVMVYALGPNI